MDHVIAHATCLFSSLNFRENFSRQLPRQQNQAAIDPEEKKTSVPGTADTVNDCTRDKALFFQTFPFYGFAGDPDDACIRGRWNMTEGKNHSIPRKP
ncbi:hypothetical protein [Clostridium sp. AF32-12BH]|uniref:hypothetical protein n=1 Tax=Clostridium sp. AF32-12BH TaxID=2292006 RepID=UPI001FAB3346|nr:hypothetical protein [Clostridium sp. AF32-12BH]